MDIEYLRSFFTVAMTKSFSEAAKKLYVSQSTLSRRVGTLENELGLTLVNRTVPVTLTQAGKQLSRDTMDIVQAYDNLIDKARLIKEKDQQVIVVQDFSHSHNFLGSIARKEAIFNEQHPQVEFLHEPCPMEYDIWKMLEDDAIDVCFLNAFGGAKKKCELTLSPEFETFEYTEMRKQLCLLISKDNPILNENPHSIADFKNTKFMSPLIRHLDSFREQFSELCKVEGDFKPVFDFHYVNEHRYFYSIDPGDSAFIVGKQMGSVAGDGLLPPNLLSQLVAIPLDGCIVSLFAIVLKRSDKKHVRDFAISLSQ